MLKNLDKIIFVIKTIKWHYSQDSQSMSSYEKLNLPFAFALNFALC